MKKLSQILAAVAVIALMPFAFSTSASAKATCEVGYTGPDSNNMCKSVTTYKCSVTNSNSVTITNSNNQVVASGAVTNSGNTSGGNATSGTVSNSNGTTFSVTITNSNSGDDEEDGVCTATAVVPAKTTPVTPVAPVQPTGAGQFEELPITSGDSTLATTATVAGAAILLAAASVGGAIAYRRAHS